MEELFHTRCLFTSSVVAVRDVRCTCRRGDFGREEASVTDSIVFPRRGAFVRHVAGESAFADANALHFFGKDQPYRVTHPIDGGDDCTVLVFAPEVLRDAFAQVDRSLRDREGAVFPVPSTPSSESVFAAMQRLRGCLAGGSMSAMRAEEDALRLLADVIERLRDPSRPAAPWPRPETRRAHRDLIFAVRALLARSFREPLSLSDIAYAVHSSPFHLARLFRRDTDMPIHRHMTRLRLRAALERLADGADDLTRLALDVGFSSHSHFSGSFRREFGRSPSDFFRDRPRRRRREMSKNLKV